MKKFVLFLLLLFAFSGLYSIYFASDGYEIRYANVTRVIDGDTFVVEGGETVRPKGFDTTEVGEECSEEATEWLEERIDDEVVKLKVTGEDVYGRTLAYAYHNDEHIGKRMVEEGLAYTYYFDKDELYIDELVERERESIESNKGCLWRHDLETEEEVVHVCDATELVSEISVVEGTVEEVSHTENITFLNFEDEYPDHCFTGVVWDSYRTRFPDKGEVYENETIRIEGIVTEYDGKPQIELRDSMQIRVLD